MQQILRPSRLAMLVAHAAVPAWAQAAYPAYQAGTAYKAGDIVSNAGALYECKGIPFTPGWCGASPYHTPPRGGVVWADAWKLYGGEVPPPALVVAIGSPVGASVSEGSVWAWR